MLGIAGIEFSALGFAEGVKVGNLGFESMGVAGCEARGALGCYLGFA